ncbi:flagellar motor switch protein FliN [bacterium]|nr:flagellar motor switch protein FliN [bacterium]
MLENDDMENINKKLSENNENEEPELEVTEAFDEQAFESNSDVSMEDIFADIPPMPADYEQSMNINSETYAGNTQNMAENNETVTVQPVKFASFDEVQSLSGDAAKNLDNLLDIKLQLTVELGRTTLPVKKVLELTRGSIIELDKIAGEPVELYANGKLIAHGEVVVIEDNFGLRITSMSEPEAKLNELK